MVCRAMQLDQSNRFIVPPKELIALIWTHSLSNGCGARTSLPCRPARHRYLSLLGLNPEFRSWTPPQSLTAILHAPKTPTVGLLYNRVVIDIVSSLTVKNGRRTPQRNGALAQDVPIPNRRLLIEHPGGPRRRGYVRAFALFTSSQQNNRLIKC